MPNRVCVSSLVEESRAHHLPEGKRSYLSPKVAATKAEKWQVSSLGILLSHNHNAVTGNGLHLTWALMEINLLPSYKVASNTIQDMG